MVETGTDAPPGLSVSDTGSQTMPTSTSDPDVQVEPTTVSVGCQTAASPSETRPPKVHRKTFATKAPQTDWSCPPERPPPTIVVVGSDAMPEEERDEEQLTSSSEC